MANYYDPFEQRSSNPRIYADYMKRWRRPHGWFYRLVMWLLRSS